MSATKTNATQATQKAGRKSAALEKELDLTLAEKHIKNVLDNPEKFGIKVKLSKEEQLEKVADLIKAMHEKKFTPEQISAALSHAEMGGFEVSSAVIRKHLVSHELIAPRTPRKPK